MAITDRIDQRCHEATDDTGFCVRHLRVHAGVRDAKVWQPRWLQRAGKDLTGAVKA